MKNWEIGKLGNGGMGEWGNRNIGRCQGISPFYYPVIFILFMNFNLLSFSIHAQVVAPTFLCVTNDTLRWDPPTNTCGAFISYLVYTSPNQNGPYTILDTITNPNQTSYFHENAGSSRRYYFLQSRYNCPGQAVLSSDTLDNMIPEPPIISSASVDENGHVLLQWTPSPSPEAYAYVISKNTSSGTAILDTVVNGNTYLDITAKANEQVETYYVTTIDRCGNSSLIPPPHSTMMLRETSGSACDRTVKLDWDLYKNWTNPIEKHEILVSENGGVPKKIAEAPGNATSYTIQNVGANTEYCFSVRAIESKTGNAAASNQSCVKLDVVPGITQLVATNATVTPDYKVSIDWRWNTDAQLKKVVIQRSSDGNNFSDINTQMPPATPLQEKNTFKDTGANPDQGTFFYRIKTVDNCDATITSNSISTIFLQSEAQGTAGNNVLKWSAYANENATNVIYEVYRLETSGAPILLGTVGNPNREWTDQLDLQNPNQAGACYFVIARAQVNLPDGTFESIESISNTACSSQSAKIYIPNAFAPNGTNRDFRPYLQFGEPSDYTLSIFDRWGGLLFQTKSLNEGWDGSSNGKDLPTGVYTYLMRLVQANGEIIQRAGTVTLLR